MRSGGLSFLIELALLLVMAGCAVIKTGSPPLQSQPTGSLPTEIPDSLLLVMPPLATTSDPHIAGVDCVGCHTQEHKRWATTLHGADVSAVLTNDEHNKAEPLTDECLYCHAPFQAGEYNVDSFVQSVDQTGPWNIVSENAGKWEAIKCETCHQPTSKAYLKLAFFDPAVGDYVQVSNTTELCEKCHQPGTDDSRNLKGSVHESLQCTDCHFQKGTEMSLDPKQSCGQCHPSKNPKHPDVTKLDTTFTTPESKNDIHFVTCQSCHLNGLPTEKP